MTPITLDTLKAICNAPDTAEMFIDPLNKYMAERQINTSLARVAGFIGNLAEESMRFLRTLEDGTGAEYEGRRDLGNTHPGDGPLFKGRGLIQITGRAIYSDCSMGLFKDYRLLTDPSILEQPEFAVASACWYWFTRGLNSVMDVPLDHPWQVKVNGKPASFGTFQWCVEKINGGQNGYAERLQYFNKALEVFGNPEPVKPKAKAKIQDTSIDG